MPHALGLRLSSRHIGNRRSRPLIAEVLARIIETTQLEQTLTPAIVDTAVQQDQECGFLLIEDAIDPALLRSALDNLNS